MGITGALRCDELVKTTIDDIEDNGSILIVRIPDCETFVIDERTYGVNFLKLFRTYAALRPTNIGHRRFFIAYRDGKCSIQVVGKNTLGKIPSVVAKFLGKPNYADYTGHCFRRTSANLLSDLAGNAFGFKRQGSWKSSTVVDGYVNANETPYTNEYKNTVLIKEEPTVISGDETEPSPTPDTSGEILENIKNYTRGTVRVLDYKTTTNTSDNTKESNNAQTVGGSEFLLNSGAITIHHATNCTFTINVQVSE